MRGSHGLSARRARRTKSSRPEGQKAGLKGRQLEVGAQRAPRLLVFYIFFIFFKFSYFLFIFFSFYAVLWVVPVNVTWEQLLLHSYYQWHLDKTKSIFGEKYRDVSAQFGVCWSTVGRYVCPRVNIVQFHLRMQLQLQFPRRTSKNIIIFLQL